ncbi:MAG: hypothetical protein DRO46_00940 [Candidatus Hecatellales archaeon]|nr:MAG: hypothetical protein DRO46_00940 [Candidatus Hecatellales archaeon]
MRVKALKGWERGDPFHVRLASKLSEAFKRKPLKLKLEESVYRLNTVKSRLDEFADKLEKKDKEYLEKCIGASSAGDKARAEIYANECSEIRKMLRLIVGSKLALEQAALRLETVREFGELASIMPSVSKLVKSIRGRLEGVLPEVSYELETVDKTLSGILFEVGEVSPGAELEVKPASKEAEEILKAANLLAEQRVKERLPSLPSSADEASHHDL